MNRFLNFANGNNLLSYFFCKSCSILTMVLKYRSRSFFESWFYATSHLRNTYISMGVTPYQQWSKFNLHKKKFWVFSHLSLPTPPQKIHLALLMSEGNVEVAVVDMETLKYEQILNFVTAHIFFTLQLFAGIQNILPLNLHALSKLR